MLPDFARFKERRRDAATRQQYAETAELGPQNFILPLFVCENAGRHEISGLKDVFHLGLEAPGDQEQSELLLELGRALQLGLRHFLLFGVVPESQKDQYGSVAQSDQALIARALRAIRQRYADEYPDLCLITDICLCGYTDHGHCGILQAEGGVLQVANDQTLPHYLAMAVAHARAGADMVAPSGMMDGQVAALRQGLDKAGLADCQILAYSAKYASAFYGPFREALGSRPKDNNSTSSNVVNFELRHRRSYQMDYRNSDEALREVAADLAEGVSQLMVKPAMTYLDIVQRVRQYLDQHNSAAELVAYHVSGEYMMWYTAVKAGVLQEWPSLREMYLALRRAGATKIISYAAPRYLQLQQQIGIDGLL